MFTDLKPDNGKQQTAVVHNVRLVLVDVVHIIFARQGPSTGEMGGGDYRGHQGQ